MVHLWNKTEMGIVLFASGLFPKAMAQGALPFPYSLPSHKVVCAV